MSKKISVTFDDYESFVAFLKQPGTATIGQISVVEDEVRRPRVAPKMKPKRRKKKAV